MNITMQDRKDWAQHPVTQEFLTQLQESLKDTQEAWAAEAFTSTTPMQGALQNACALGGVRVLKDLNTQILDLVQLPLGGGK